MYVQLIYDEEGKLRGNLTQVYVERLTYIPLNTHKRDGDAKGNLNHHSTRKKFHIRESRLQAQTERDSLFGSA